MLYPNDPRRHSCPAVPGERCVVEQLGPKHCHLAQDYPAQPFFLRVVTPRCVWYTGHVTAGGSICIEALTLSGGPNGWTSALCVESVLTLVITNMCASSLA